MSAKIWDEATISAKAGEYRTKSDFQRGCGGAYVACISRYPGLMDTLFDNQIRYWKDEASVREEAKKYTSRAEFRKGTPGASKSAIAKFPHVLDEIFGSKLRVVWDLDSLILEAQDYPSRRAFQDGSGGAYNAFRRFPGELDKIFPLRYKYWGNEVDIRAEASKYRTKADFVYGCVSAYGAALGMGIIDDLGFESGGSGFDTTAPGFLYVTGIALTCGGDGTMFGVTNRTPTIRYTGIERAFMSDGSAYLFKVGADALRIETLLRRTFSEFAVIKGQSPLRDKQGTAGEILSGVPKCAVMSAIAEFHDDLPECQPW